MEQAGLKLTEIDLPLSAGFKGVHHQAQLEMVSLYQCSVPKGSMLFRHISQINPDGKFVFKSCLHFGTEFLTLEVTDHSESDLSRKYP